MVKNAYSRIMPDIPTNRVDIRSCKKQAKQKQFSGPLLPPVNANSFPFLSKHKFWINCRNRVAPLSKLQDTSLRLLPVNNFHPCRRIRHKKYSKVETGRLSASWAQIILDRRGRGFCIHNNKDDDGNVWSLYAFSRAVSYISYHDPLSVAQAIWRHE